MLASFQSLPCSPSYKDLERRQQYDVACSISTQDRCRQWWRLLVAVVRHAMLVLTHVRVFFPSCHAIHGRATSWDEWVWEDKEYDDEGNIVKYDYLDYVFIGNDFKRDGESIRWVAAYRQRKTLHVHHI